ncbi:MAG: hypothetical protein IPO31_02770 [Candidatus Obscuribacter sp.]|nr:hypothetical protein [Candidatus Obscuribacter sp.]
MYDCSTCKVPLHDHEVVCPSCGTKQRRRSVSKMLGPEARKPPVNVMPFVVAIMAVIIGFIVMAQSSCMGQLMHRPPKVEDPMDKVTFTQARQTIDQRINEALAQNGGKGTVKWTREGTEVDKNTEGPVEVTCDLELPDPNQRNTIVEPVKDYFEKAGITSLTLNVKSGTQTFNKTYTVSKAPADASGAAPVEGEAAPAQ